jgi:SNF2 family DNA or RNA helicase
MFQLAKKLQCHALVHGQQTLEERNAAVSDFQTNQTNIIIVQIRAGGVGLSLHDLIGDHPRKALHNCTWSGIEFLQALGRTHRAGGKTAVEQFLIFVADSYEVEMCKLVNKKIHNLNAINDGDLIGADIAEEDIHELDEAMNLIADSNELEIEKNG